MCAALVLMMASGFETSSLSHWSALAAGALAALSGGLDQLAPTHIQHWQAGAWGEQRTAKALRHLRRKGWYIRHDLKFVGQRGNLDHVLVGPGGVFLLDTKNLTGWSELAGGVVLTRPVENPECVSPMEIGPWMLARSADLKSRIEAQCGVRRWVQAVVVLWSEFPQGAVEHDHVMYVDGRELVAWLKERPAQLDSSAVEQIAAAVRAIS